MLVGQVFEVDARRADARVVEQQIEAAEGFLRFREQRAHRSRVADIGRDRDRATGPGAGLDHDLLQRLLAPPRERDPITLAQQRERDGLADTRSGSRDDGDLVVRGHG